MGADIIIIVVLDDNPFIIKFRLLFTFMPHFASVISFSSIHFNCLYIVKFSFSNHLTMCIVLIIDD